MSFEEKYNKYYDAYKSVKKETKTGIKAIQKKYEGREDVDKAREEFVAETEAFKGAMADKMGKLSEKVQKLRKKNKWT